VGGESNRVVEATGDGNFMGGGASNRIQGDYLYSNVIIGGSQHYINGTNCSRNFIGGGNGNDITGDYTYRNTIVGGENNEIKGGYTYQNFIGGGSTNEISSSSENSSIIGGTNNTVGHNNVHIIGSNITSTVADVTYVNDLIIDGLTSTDPLATDANGKIVAGASDERLKTNIEDLELALEKVLNLRGVSYEWTEESNMGSGVKKYGLIAQEVKEIIPDMVRERVKTDGMLTLDYKEIIPFLIESIKKLNDEIKNLKDELNNK